jgi:hypothetical protein
MIRSIITLFLVLAAGTAIAQEKEYTDKEIGFNREVLRKELYENNPFVKREFLESQLDNIRKDLVLRHELGLTKWYKQTQTDNIDVRNSSNSRLAVFVCDSTTFNSEISQPLGSSWELRHNQPNPGYQYSDNNPVLVTNYNGTSYSYGGQVRYEVATSFNDPYLNALENIENSLPPTTRYLKLGNGLSGTRREKISKPVHLYAYNQDEIIFYRFAIVLQDPGHGQRPYFSTGIKVNGELQECSVVMYEAPQYGVETVPGFQLVNENSVVFARPWTSNFIRPSDFNAGPGDVISLEVAVSDCGAGGHFGYAYFDIECISLKDVINISPGPHCVDSNIQFAPGFEITEGNYTWVIKNSNGDIVAGPVYSPLMDYTPTAAGNYTAVLTIPYFTTSDDENCDISSTFETPFSVSQCVPEECDDCNSFTLLPNERYIVSGWVKEKTEDDQDIQVRTYQDSYIKVGFYDNLNAIIGAEYNFYGSGEVIDGWQRIYGEVTVPANVQKVHFVLKNDSDHNVAFFDDVRVNPLNGSLKSFVYDQKSQKLMAELDENNYSTFYEYDKEGGLVRVKKETEKGIYTIQETRSANSKTQNTDGN